MIKHQAAHPISGKRSDANKPPDLSEGFSLHPLVTPIPSPHATRTRAQLLASRGLIRTSKANVQGEEMAALTLSEGERSLSLPRSLSLSEISFLMVWNETHYSQLTCHEPTVLAGLPIIIHL